MLSPQELVLQAADTAFAYAEKGQQSKAEKYLISVYHITQKFPQVLWNHPESWKLAKAYLLLYHFDSIPQESENITSLQKAYIYAQNSITLCKSNPKEKDNFYQGVYSQILLLSTCVDGYETILTHLYINKAHSTNLRLAQALAAKVLLLITYILLVEIDDNFENFNNNADLEHLCNTIEIENPDITVKKIDEAQKIAVLLTNHCLQAFKN